MVICKVSMDLANNNSAVATALYEVLEDGTRRRIPGTSRLWNDLGARQRNSCLIPSVILYKEKNSELSRDCYGYDALAMIKQSSTPFKLSNHIKYRFFVENDPYGDNAIDFTNLAKYLLDLIDFEGVGEPDAYEISVSYPVICDDENLYQLENIIYDALAGHSRRIERIDFINEAECAFRFAVSDKTVQTAIYNTLTVKDKAIMLVCDIGGSTMELSLYCFTRDGKKVQFTRKGILRGDDKEGRGLGSYAMDKALRNKLYGSGLLDQNSLRDIPEALLMLRWITPLKEGLNNRLRIGKNGSLDSLQDIAVPEKLKDHNTVNQQQFEQWCRGYTAAVCKQIKNLAEQAELKPEDIDLAILTGGGCKLYPVKTAIQELLKPDNRDTACVLCPDDPSSILDGKIIQEDNPDFCNGLCPKTELVSLACVLGNLAEEVELTMPVEDPIGVIPIGENDIGKKKPEENVHEKRYSSFRPCPEDGFVAYWFKRCNNKGYSCNNYCECNSVCTKDTCSCVSECGCDYNCRNDYDCFCEYEREY